MRCAPAGDPSRVTVIGESSGGTSVLALLASPVAAADDLFQRAIAISPGARIDQPASAVRRRNMLDADGLLARTRCADHLKAGGDAAPADAPPDGGATPAGDAAAAAALRSCLYSLTAEELVLAKPAAWGDASWTFDLPAPYGGVSGADVADVARSDDPRFLDEAGAVGHLGVYAPTPIISAICRVQMHMHVADLG